MKRWIVLAAGLGAFCAAAAGSARVGSSLVLLGDTGSHVLKMAGKPTMQSDVQNRRGAVVARRLDYDEGNETISICVGQDGRVAEITETYN
jgi:hypothetical protein